MNFFSKLDCDFFDWATAKTKYVVKYKQKFNGINGACSNYFDSIKQANAAALGVSALKVKVKAGQGCPDSRRYRRFLAEAE